MKLRLSEITYENLKIEVNYYLEKVYNKANILFSKSSPFGQVLDVVENLFQLSMLYIRNSINQFNLTSANSSNYNVIRSAAIVAGHNPRRASSASGTLRCRVRVSTDINNEIPGNQINIKNKTLIKNNTNNLKYYIDLGGADEQVYNIRQGTSFFINIVQGEWKASTTFTGTGEPNQSYEVASENKEIENDRIEVRVNGELWEIKNHLYEMLPDENAVAIKTSFEGGITIIFGNNNYGSIPYIGSVIEVRYVETDGQLGNIYRRTTDNWRILDDITAGDGSPVSFEKLFNIFIDTDINFGANSEDLEYMRNLLPLNMNNFVLAQPKQYAYAIKRLGIFSYVNAYLERGTIRIIATPNIKIFRNTNSDYYSIDKSAFSLDSYERTKLDNYLRKGGYIQLTQKYTIDTPVLSYYVIYINLQIFDDAIEDNIKNQIIELLSEYFLNINRQDRIPKKDIINRVSQIDGVDSVDIRFLSKKNEDYHKRFKLKQNNSIQARNETALEQGVSAAFTPANSSPLLQSLPQGELNGYEKNRVLGLDPNYGDIILENQEVPILRGGWSDRNGIYYNEEPLDGFSTVNIRVTGITPRNNVR